MARYQAEAEGLRKVLQAKADGYKKLMDSCADNKELAPTLLMIEKLPELGRTLRLSKISTLIRSLFGKMVVVLLKMVAKVQLLTL